MSSAVKKASAKGSAVEHCIVAELEKYFVALGSEKPSGVHRMVLVQAERAVIQFVVDQVDGNQSHAADILGISRGTLR
ncbi:MAG: helix-turn-helix domain-containing protein, partial [Pseudomonadota bacterium]